MDADPSISTKIMVILLLIFANGIFAMTEIAIVSSRKARLEKKAAEGSAGAGQALELANDPTELLSTVQVGITLIGIVTGAFGGTTIAQALSVYIAPLPFIGAHSHGRQPGSGHCGDYLSVLDFWRIGAEKDRP